MPGNPLEIQQSLKYDRDWFPEVMGFVPCTACHELTARAYLRVLGDKHVCIPCSGYER
jgi:formylmethanofuran dehydrogenase subunit E